MKKNFISVLVTALLTGTLLAGCGREAVLDGNQSTENTGNGAVLDGNQSTENTGNGDGYTIGINCFGSSSYALLTLANNSEKVFEVYGDSTTVSDDAYQLDTLVQNIENMVAKGVDGLIVWLPTDNLYATIGQLCEENEIPFVLNDKIPTDPEVAESIIANPYFAGAVSPANAVYGEQMADFAIDQGYKSCIISSSTVGDPSDTPRLEAFIEKFEAAGGEIMDELHSDGADAGQTALEDSLLAHPDVDFVYAVGSDYGITACSVLENQGNTDIKVMTSGLDSEAVNLLESGQLEMLSGDNWVSGIYSAVILENYLDGNMLKDGEGNVPYIQDIMPFELNSDQCTLYRKCFIDNFCYTDEEIESMRTKNNAEFDYNTFMEIVNSFSFTERASALCEAGVVTEDELAAAGIN